MLNKISFFEYDKVETEKMLEEMFKEPTATVAETTETEEPKTVVTTTQASQVKIELLNGSETARN